MKLLIVEDDLEQHEILSKVLGKEGFELKFVTTSDACLQLLESEFPLFDAVLLDHQLAPESSLDGIETLKQIREREINITAIMMTAYGTQDVIIEAIKGHSDDFLTKPLNYSNLADIIRKNVNKREELYPRDQKIQIKDFEKLIRQFDPFSNFVLLKHSIPIFLRGEWYEIADKEQTNPNSVMQDQLLMSGFISAIQTLSRTIFGQSVNELSSEVHQIIFKQSENYLCAIKIKSSEFFLLKANPTYKAKILEVMDEVLEYIKNESKKKQIVKLTSDQITYLDEFIERKIVEFRNIGDTNTKKSLFQKLFNRISKN